MKSSFFFLFIIIAFSSISVPQTSGSEEEKETILNTIHYQDQIGLKIAFEYIPIENYIDVDTYVLGPNDLVTINVKGPYFILLRGIIINPQGDIVIPIAGTINLRDKTIHEAQILIKEKISETYKNPEVVLTLDQPRLISIHVTGNIPHPGKYILPPQSRVDFAIFQALTDGNREPMSSKSYSADALLSENYSLRNIRATDKNGVVNTADLISYYRTGIFEKNPFVKDGDVISIYRRDNKDARTSMSGAVKVPLEIEYLNSDTPASLLQLAGNFKPEADTTKLLLLRKNGNELERIEIFRDQWENFELKPNDRIIALSSHTHRISASAWITGEINVPGNYPIIDGETTALDLLEVGNNLTDKALPEAGYLIRAGSIKNEVPNKFNTELLKRTSDQLVQGLQYLDLETKLSRNQVFINLSDRDQLATVKLFDGDRLFVPRDENTLFVFGQVNNPGYFPFDRTKSVQDFIRQAGGFSLSANSDRVFIVKAGNKTWYKSGDTPLSSGDMIFVDRVPNDELNAQRSYDIQKRQLRISNTQIILSSITTITAIVTTVVAIRNR